MYYLQEFGPHSTWQSMTFVAQPFIYLLTVEQNEGLIRSKLRSDTPGCPDTPLENHCQEKSKQLWYVLNLGQEGTPTRVSCAPQHLGQCLVYAC